jgi:simple sugar transport system permease protein
VLLPVVAVVAALLLGALIIAFAGLNPLRAYAALARGAFGSVGSFSETLVRFCPLALCALGVLVAFRAGFFSIGADGQFYLGALAATFVALKVPALPSIVLVPLCMAGAMAAGTLWALVAGLLKVRLGVNEVVSTIMLNAIASLLIDFLVRGPLRAPGTDLQYTAVIPKFAWLPRILPHTRLHAGVFLPLIAALLVYIFLWRMSAGFDSRVTGANSVAARHAGINVGGSVLGAVAISGALAGLAGAVEIQAVFHRLQAGIGSDYGYTAIPIALVGKTLPGATLLAALIFAALGVGSAMMQIKASVPSPLVVLLQGLIILFVVGSDMFVPKLRKWRQTLPPETTSGNLPPMDPSIAE